MAAARGRRFRRGRELALLAASTAFALVALELATRWLDPRGISHLEESTRYHLDKVPDPVLVYRHRAGFRAVYQGVEVTTNELGLRERPVGPKPPDELRLLLLGDSVTLGWGVRAEHTFARRLEGLLAQRLGRRVRTVNAGVGSYNTLQELALLERHGARIDPDGVLLVYVANDVEPVAQPFDPWSERSLRGKPPGEAARLILQRSWLYRLAHTLRIVRGPPPEPLALGDSPGWQQSAAALRALASRCRERDAFFAVFVWRLWQPAREERLVAAIEALGRREGFAVADVGTWWPAGDLRGLRNSFVDAHPNARGHAIVAEGMARFLVQRGLALPDAGGERR